MEKRREGNIYMKRFNVYDKVRIPSRFTGEDWGIIIKITCAISAIDCTTDYLIESPNGRSVWLRGTQIAKFPKPRFRKEVVIFT